MYNTDYIAYIYAKAVFDLSKEQKNITQWQSILKLFADISCFDLIQSLCCRYLTPQKLSNIFISICEDYQKKKINLYGRNLIHIMAENNRLQLLPIVLNEFNHLNFLYMKIVEIEVVSAHDLTHMQLQKVTKIMKHRLCKKIKIVHKINKNIIAGIIIRVGDTVIDGSIRGRISRLSCMLQY